MTIPMSMSEKNNTRERSFSQGEDWMKVLDKFLSDDDEDEKQLAQLCTENAEKDGITDVLGLNQPLDTCVEDQHNPGNYGRITACNSEYFMWEDFGTDTRCRGYEDGVYEYLSG